MIRALVSTLLSRKGAVLGLTEASLKTGERHGEPGFLVTVVGVKGLSGFSIHKRPTPGHAKSQHRRTTSTKFQTGGPFSRSS